MDRQALQFEGAKPEQDRAFKIALAFVSNAAVENHGADMRTGSGTDDPGERAGEAVEIVFICGECDD